MNRFILMGIITLIMLVIIFTYNPNGRYLAIYEDKVTIDYNVDKGYNLSMDLSGKSLFLEKKEIDNNNISWTFLPNADGTTVIEFVYKKDGEENSIYTVTYELKVIDNKIYWIKGDAKGLLDFPNPK